MKIVNEHGTECSLSEFLQTLDLDQLRRAKEMADENIERITTQKKVKLIRVGDQWTVDRYFPIDKYLEAVQYMAEKAARDYPKYRETALSLDFCLMYEDQAKDTLDNWNREAGA